MSAWQCHIAASALNVTFARTIAWCLSTMSWAVNTSLGIASDIESTSLLCWPSGAGARHRRRMSSQVCSLYRCESRWSKRVMDIRSIWITYSSYHYGPWRVVINAYFSSDMVQFDPGGTTQNLGRIVPAVGADRPRLGRIVCKPHIRCYFPFLETGIMVWKTLFFVHEWRKIRSCVRYFPSLGMDIWHNRWHIQVTGGMEEQNEGDTENTVWLNTAPTALAPR